jgi:hypothetical protein
VTVEHGYSAGQMSCLYKCNAEPTKSPSPYTVNVTRRCRHHYLQSSRNLISQADYVIDASQGLDKHAGIIGAAETAEYR